MNTTTTHTPTPWSLSGQATDSFVMGRPKYGRTYKTIVAEVYGIDDELFAEEARANLEYIVRACNCHDELLAACRELAQKAENMNGWQHSGHFNEPIDWSELNELTIRAKAAIARAEGEI